MAPAVKPTTSTKAKLGKKVGPLPVWAWGVIVLAVVAFFFLRSRGAFGGRAGGVGSDENGPLASGGGSPGGGGASGDGGGPNVVPLGQPSSIVGDGTGDGPGSTGTVQTINPGPIPTQPGALDWIHQDFVPPTSIITQPAGQGYVQSVFGPPPAPTGAPPGTIIYNNPPATTPPSDPPPGATHPGLQM